MGPRSEILSSAGVCKKKNVFEEWVFVVKKSGNLNVRHISFV